MKEIINNQNNHHTKSINNNVLKTLLYFDIFHYPLTENEIINYAHSSVKETKKILGLLIEKGLLHKIDDFYSLSSNQENSTRRLKGNKKASQILKKADKVSKFISQFPFVEGVFISGSLSKGYFGEDDDIDYFIITSPNRLWLARTLLIAYKKIFLLNSKKYFCVNYFMSRNALKFSEKNRFTATEFVTLIPMSGNGLYQELQKNNPWILDYFPNYKLDKKANPIRRKGIKRILEFSLNGKIGDILDKKFMKITKNHQQNKFKKLHQSDFNIAFKGDENTSKHHPDNHQIRVIKSLNKKITEFNKQHQLNIPLED